MAQTASSKRRGGAALATDGASGTATAARTRPERASTARSCAVGSAALRPRRGVSGRRRALRGRLDAALLEHKGAEMDGAQGGLVYRDRSGPSPPSWAARAGGTSHKARLCESTCVQRGAAVTPSAPAGAAPPGARAGRGRGGRCLRQLWRSRQSAPHRQSATPRQSAPSRRPTPPRPPPPRRPPPPAARRTSARESRSGRRRRRRRRAAARGRRTGAPRGAGALAATCPVSTGGGTRRVRLVRGQGGGGPGRDQTAERRSDSGMRVPWHTCPVPPRSALSSQRAGSPPSSLLLPLPVSLLYTRRAQR